ncbi:MAG: hypothetical protein ACOC0M_02745 [Halomonas sp.]
MTDPTGWPPVIQLAGLLSISSGITLAAVKSMIGSHSTSVNGAVESLRRHIDDQIDGLGERLDSHEVRLEGHTRQLHEHELALLKQRNEMLESLRDRSVSREEFAQLLQQIAHIDDRISVVSRGAGASQ